jgi:hypothetical protein
MPLERSSILVLHWLVSFYSYGIVSLLIVKNGIDITLLLTPRLPQNGIGGLAILLRVY